jgi:hypothetical protein
MIDETVDKVRGENKRLHMRTLIFAEDLLICRKDENESEGILFLWNLTIKEYVLKMNTDRDHEDSKQQRHKHQNNS